MATVGEYALDNLVAFEQIHDAAINGGQPPLEASDMFMASSLRLMRTFPPEWRERHGRKLPFTGIELHFLETRGWEQDETLRQKIAERLGDWVSMRSVYVDERAVACSSYLFELRPHLDLWQERERAEQLAKKLVAEPTF